MYSTCTKTQTQYFTGQNNKILINNEKNAILLLLWNRESTYTI